MLHKAIGTLRLRGSSCTFTLNVQAGDMCNNLHTQFALCVQMSDSAVGSASL